MQRCTSHPSVPRKSLSVQNHIPDPKRGIFLSSFLLSESQSLPNTLVPLRTDLLNFTDIWESQHQPPWLTKTSELLQNIFPECSTKICPSFKHSAPKVQSNAQLTKITIEGRAQSTLKVPVLPEDPCSVLSRVHNSPQKVVTYKELNF